MATQVKNKYEKISEFDFSIGKHTSPEKMQSWHGEALIKLQDKNLSHICLRSGNGMIIGFKDGDGSIEIFEIRNYKSTTYMY